MNATLVDLGALVAKSVRDNAAKVAATPSVDSAKRFIVSARKARDNHEKIAALTEFVGYNASEALGAQIDNATRVAQKLLSTAVKDRNPSKPYARTTAAPTVQGYVAGMPDNISRQRGQLEAIEREIVEKLCATDTQELRTQLTEVRARLNSLG